MSKLAKKYKNQAKKERHTKRRSRERYNLHQFNKIDEDRIVTKIITGDSIYVRNDGENEFHYVMHNNIPIKFLYNPEFRYLITTNPFITEEYNALKALKEKENNKLSNKFEGVITEVGKKEMAKAMKHNVIKWCDIAGYEAFNYDNAIYLKRADVFLNNESITNSLILRKILVRGKNFITLNKKDYPENTELFKRGTLLSLVRIDSLEPLLEKGVVNNTDIKQNIKNIIKAGQQPMRAEDCEKFKDSLQNEPFIVEPFEDKYPDDETIQQLLERVAKDPSKVKLIPVMKETTITELLKQTQEHIGFAIKEIEEKDEIKGQLERTVEKFNTLQADWNIMYENYGKVNKELQDLKEELASSKTLLGKVKSLFNVK